MAKARMATLLFDLENDPGQTVCKEENDDESYENYSLRMMTRRYKRCVILHIYRGPTKEANVDPHIA
jgi:hypothetical protein